MHKNFFLHPVVIITLFLIFFTTLFLYSENNSDSQYKISNVTIAWESELKPPYLMRAEDQKLYGIAVDLVTEIFRRNNITVTNIDTPWKRCLILLKNRQVDVVPNSSFKEERAEFAYFSEPLYETNLVLFYRKDKFPQPPVINRAEDLQNYRVGGVINFNYHQYKDKLVLDTSAPSRLALLKKLERDRLDFAILQKEVIQLNAKENGISLKKFAYVPDPYFPKKFFHILTAKNEKGKTIKTILDEGIKNLKQDGTYQKIFSRYLENN